jgi:hypothetical protein
MRIPKYWARGEQTVMGMDGQQHTFACWQPSDESFADAQRKADARASQVAQKLAAHQTLDRYAYGDRALREEIQQVIKSAWGKELAIVSRNGYGALVLNTAQAMFIDIDFPEKGLGEAAVAPVRRLFGGAPPNPEAAHLQQVEAWAARRPDLGLRVYRTFGGLRCLITNALFDPSQAEAQSILRELNSDPLYVRLCQAQECFRARLTPKPWRCGIRQQPPRYPWPDVSVEARFRQWLQRYEATSARYMTCRLVKEIGPRDVHPDIEPILSLHDQLACSLSNLSLA